MHLSPAAAKGYFSEILISSILVTSSFVRFFRRFIPQTPLTLISLLILCPKGANFIIWEHSEQFDYGFYIKKEVLLKWLYYIRKNDFCLLTDS